jgi:hypothetical protein
VSDFRAYKGLFDPEKGGLSHQFNRSLGGGGKKRDLMVSYLQKHIDRNGSEEKRNAK